MRFPLDLEPEFIPTWEAFLELTAVQDTLKINPLVVEDAFRLLLIQAGIKQVKTLYNVKRFITVNKSVQTLKRRLDLSHVLAHMNVRKHDIEISMPIAKQINVIHRPQIIGYVQLKPRSGFTLEYLLNRMLELKVFRHEIPPVLTGQRFPSILTVREYDYHALFKDEKIGVATCRLKNGSLLLRYDVTFDSVVPAYKNAESQFKALWQTETRGIFR